MLLEVHVQPLATGGTGVLRGGGDEGGADPLGSTSLLRKAVAEQVTLMDDRAP
ncbi:hypothetical protein STRTUCAR8_04740 [Streptomyces turgidiscabies Car8]|uniref:Uncharacterized protein n=1 Tax=Streptomyces turgidiscabies (strain Car8) TaxID=698760 RepID=L7EUB2_STRT8|nr:hypothetical protein STRTUCAR8_04740 [Streptomyces turgidiscabies Car8]